MENTLHACTPARCAWAQTATPLGTLPARRLPNTLAAHTRYAFTLVSSLFGEGIPAFQNQRSGIVDLTSPNALRPTLRPKFAPSALRSYLVLGTRAISDPVSCQCNHNSCESITLNTRSYSSIHDALQATSMPINENAPCGNGLVDCPSRSQNPQKWLSGALNGIPCLLLPLYSITIHNYQLSINSRDFWPVTIVERTDQWCNTNTHCKQKNVLTNQCTLTTVNCAIEPLCPCSKQKWVEKGKMTIFSLFNLKNKEPWIGQKVNRGFLAAALRKSGIDFLPNPWHIVATQRARALTAALCEQRADCSRRPASKPGVFKYMEIGLDRLLSLRETVSVVVVLFGMVNGAEQVTRTVLVAFWVHLFPSPLALQAVSGGLFGVHFVTLESEVC